MNELLNELLKYFHNPHTPFQTDRQADQDFLTAAGSAAGNRILYRLVLFLIFYFAGMEGTLSYSSFSFASFFFLQAWFLLKQFHHIGNP